MIAILDPMALTLWLLPCIIFWIGSRTWAGIAQDDVSEPEKSGQHDRVTGSRKFVPQARNQTIGGGMMDCFALNAEKEQNITNNQYKIN